MTKNTQLPIEKLIAIYGSANKTATALSCNRQLVDGWRIKGVIPYKWGKPIETITKGKVTASEIWQAASKLY